MSTLTQSFVLNASAAAQNYNPPGPPGPTGIAINLAANLGPVSPFIFGVGTEGGGSPGINDFDSSANPGWQAWWRNSFPNGLYRFNTEGTYQDWMTAAGVGGGGDAQSALNWVNNLGSFWNTSTMRQVFGSGQIITPGANDIVAIAQMFKNKGAECFYWEGMNEPEGFLDPGSWASNYRTIRSALKGFNSSYQVGGPTVNGSFDLNNYFGALGDASLIDFVCYHSYWGQNKVFGDAASNYAAAINTAINDLSNIPGALRGKPIFAGEYSINYNPGASNDPATATLDGAVSLSLFLYTTLTGHSDQSNGHTSFQMGAVWTIPENGWDGVVNVDGSVPRPRVYVLSILNQKMGGGMQQGSCAYGSSVSGANIRCLGTMNPAGQWTVWITNFDVNSSTPLVITGLTGLAYNFWQINPSNSATSFPGGAPDFFPSQFNSSPTITTGNQMSGGTVSLSVPAKSVTVLSNH